jgi:hypothetical protein
MFARVERLFVVGCAVGSAGMNLAAANTASLRAVLAYVVPPLFLAAVVDRTVSVVRRHYLGEADASAWSALGRVTLYATRLFLAPVSTTKGFRRWVLNSAPVPEPDAPGALSIVSDALSTDAVPDALVPAPADTVPDVNSVATAPTVLDAIPGTPATATAPTAPDAVPGAAANAARTRSKMRGGRRSPERIFREELEKGTLPSVRAIQRECRIGRPKATAIREQMMHQLASVG